MNYEVECRQTHKEKEERKERTLRERHNWFKVQKEEQGNKNLEKEQLKQGLKKKERNKQTKR